NLVAPVISTAAEPGCHCDHWVSLFLWRRNKLDDHKRECPSSLGLYARAALEPNHYDRYIGRGYPGYPCGLADGGRADFRELDLCLGSQTGNHRVVEPIRN